jgi:hypothetical protein
VALIELCCDPDGPVAPVVEVEEPAVELPVAVVPAGDAVVVVGAEGGVEGAPAAPATGARTSARRTESTEQKTTQTAATVPTGDAGDGVADEGAPAVGDVGPEDRRDARTGVDALDLMKRLVFIAR